MLDINTLLSAVTARAAHENKVRFDGRERIQLERFKGAGVRGVFSEMPNDFCVFIDTPDNPGPFAVFLFVMLEEDVLRCTLRLSDVMNGFREDRELQSLPTSLGTDEIARRLVESVVDETTLR